MIILDTSTRAFDRLSGEFKGQAIRGDGTDEDVLRKAGAEGADAFLALTEGDNRNVMAAQVAMEKLVGRQGRRQDQRPGARRRVRRARDRDRLPDDDADRRDPGLPGPAPDRHAVGHRARAARPRRRGRRRGGRGTAAPRLGAQPVSTPPEA